MIVDELVAILGYETRGEEKLRSFTKSLDTVTSRLVKFAAAAGTIAATAMAAFGKSVISTTAEFEGYAATLETIEGSSEKAQQSLDWISDFAKKTPFEMGELTQAFVRLRAYGMDPTQGLMESLGDAASGMGKDLMAAVEMISDASTGEFERLKEFGIKAKQAGDEVVFSWSQNGKDFSKTVKKTGTEITKFIQDQFGERFSGAMLRQSKTWNGMMSNLSDSWVDFQRRVGEGGFFDAVKAQLGRALDAIGRLDADGTLDRWSKSLSDGLTAGVDAAIFAFSRLQKHFEFLSGWISANPDLWSKIAIGLGLIAAVVFPQGAAILILEDLLTYLEGGDSIIGKIADSLSELTGMDPGPLGNILASLAGAAGTFFLFGGSFGMVAKGIIAIGSAMKGLAGAELLKDIGLAGTAAGGAYGTAFGIAAKAAIIAAVIAALEYFDPKGNLGGLTSPVDDAIRRGLGLPEKGTGVTPGEIVEGIGNLLTPSTPVKPGEADAQGNISARPDQKVEALNGILNNLSANMAKTGEAGSLGAVTNTLNDSSDKSVSVTVNQSVTQATQAPGEAARATGDAVARSAKPSGLPPTRVVGTGAF
jgi:hypothetical protein